MTKSCVSKYRARRLPKVRLQIISSHPFGRYDQLIDRIASNILYWYAIIFLGRLGYHRNYLCVALMNTLRVNPIFQALCPRNNVTKDLSVI